jgi:hypothetical protein
MTCPLDLHFQMLPDRFLNKVYRYDDYQFGLHDHSDVLLYQLKMISYMKTI